ncbi:type I polyketide synthase, partial [Nostoc sp. CHAB 5715]|uniref:type I polyketide synthase n=1 Tax=Nostoc sp. CHAB 5715 TaxID=2780400 RepID=UPI001E3161AB
MNNDSYTLNHSNSIAIIGMSCRFPGARNVDEFWQNLKNGVESISFFSDDELKTNGIDPSLLKEPNYVKAAPILDEVEYFDASFFEYSPKEAEFMDPQHRFFLECSWEALENAGYNSTNYKGAIGVYAGAGGSISSYLLAYADRNRNFVGSTGSFQHIGNDKDFLTTRVSFKLNLKGPSVTVQTACSTSLVSVHLACQSLLNGECDMALAGGVTIRVPHKAGYFTQEGGIVSADGHCRAFDAKAQGTIFGSGVGVVVLKPLENAIADGDCIYAVIKGSAINNDGSSKISYTASSVDGQAQAIAEALAIAQVEPETVTYIEAHGTGTSLGDPLEITALTQVFRTSTHKQGFCALGSVKTNIGHLEAAAGIAGLIKTVLALKHQYLPPSLHFEEPNPKIDFASSPFYVNTTLSEWKTDITPRRAGVNSLGIGGTNAYLVLEEAPRLAKVTTAIERPRQLLTLSAKSQTALREIATKYEQHLKANRSQSLADICFTANTGRSHFAHRLTVSAASTAEIGAQLAAFLSEKQQPGVENREILSSQKPKIAFLFTGQGSQYIRMGRQLYDTQPTFRQILDKCDALVSPYLGQSLLSVLYPETGITSPIDETAYTQPALFALEYAVAQLWRTWGIEPSIVIGHSLGEYVAACIAGVFSLEDGLRLVAQRGKLMQSLPANGQMVAVFANAAKVTELIAPYAPAVVIAAENTPENIVISGENTDIEAVLTKLKSESIHYQRLSVSHAFHSPLMQPMLNEFKQVAKQVKYATPKIELISNVSGQMVSGSQMSQAQYWCEHILQPVRFSQGMTTLQQQGVEIFLEVGSSPMLLGMGRQCLPKTEGAWLPSLRQGQDDWQQMLHSLAVLYVHGCAVDWVGFDRDYQRCRVALPTYPFQRQRFWLEAVESRSTLSLSAESTAKIHPFLGQRLQSPLKEIQFEAKFSKDTLAFLDDHRIYDVVVVPGACYVSMILSAAQEVFGRSACVVEDVIFPQALIIPENEVETVQLILSLENSGIATFQIFSNSADGENQHWKLHATGKIRIGQTDTVELAQKSAIEEMQTQCQQQMSRAEFYQEFYQTRQINLGSSFQWIEQAWQGNGEALCQMRQAVAEVDAYQLHPGLIDSCLQLAIANLPNTTYVPISIDSFKYYGQTDKELWCQVQMQQGVGSNQQTYTANIQLFDQNQQIVAQITGLHLVQANREALQRVMPAQKNDWLYEIAWLAKPQPEIDTIHSSNHSHWLIFADTAGIGTALAQQLESNGKTCTIVSRGTSYEQIDNNYRLNPAQPEEFQQLLQQLKLTQPPVQGIIHLWSLDTTPAAVTSITTLETAQIQGCGSGLHLVQALVQQGQTPLPRLWIVTQGTQAVAQQPIPLAVAQAPLWGLGRVIALEHPEIWGGLIDLDWGNPQQQAATLLSEIQQPDGEQQLAWRQGKRYVPRLVRSKQPLTQLESARLDSDGTYLITGGFGGLGLQLAQWMVEQGARHLVLVGRNPPSDLASQAIAQLEKTGVEVIIALADVSSQGQIVAVLAQMSQSMPPLKGIIHAAGILDDGVLLQQHWQRFAKVMAAKVAGAWNLHRFTQHLSLDFFVLFSSVVSMLGSPGQGNYAAANAFLDALAHQRRQQGQRAVSINWGPWATVGMAASLGERGEKQWAAQGIEMLKPQLGWKLFEQVLSSNHPQVGVLRVNWSQWLQQFSFVEPPRWLSALGGEVPFGEAKVSQPG